MAQTWDEWQELLEDRFFSGASDGLPFVMFVDTDELTDLDGDGARERLARAVADDLSEDGGAYSRIVRRLGGWSSSSGQPPPVLPLLAASVLAATDMETSGGHSQANYYTRLAQFLKPDESHEWRPRLERDFSSVADLWQSLSDWVEDHLGRPSTISRHPRLVYVGYPLSQALIRRADQNALSYFWSKIGLVPGEEPPPGDELLRSLRRWITPSRGLSARFLQTIASLPKELEDLMGESLRLSARGWNGELRDHHGDRVDRAHLALTMVGSTAVCDWLIGDVDDVTTLKTTPLHADHLLHGLRDGKGNLQHPPAAFVLLRFDSGVQRWVEVQDFRPKQEHALVYLSEVWAQSAKRFAMASDTSNLTIPRRVEGVPEARAVTDLRFADRDRLTAALSEASMRGLVFESHQRPRLTLSDGLNITNALSSRVYIAGGAPDLVLPEGSPDERVEVSLDESPATPFVRSGLAVPLRLLDLGPGLHSLAADETTLTFEIVDDPIEVAARPEINAVTFNISEDTFDEAMAKPHLTRVAGGAILLENDQPSKMDTWGARLGVARRGMEESFLIGPAGHVRQVLEPSLPLLWSEMQGDLKSWTFFVERDKFEGWLFQRRHHSVFVTELAPVPATATPSDAAYVDWMQWRELLVAGGSSCTTDAWRALVHSAGVG